MKKLNSLVDDNKNEALHPSKRHVWSYLIYLIIVILIETRYLPILDVVEVMASAVNWLFSSPLPGVLLLFVLIIVWLDMIKDTKFNHPRSFFVFYIILRISLIFILY